MTSCPVLLGRRHRSGRASGRPATSSSAWRPWLNWVAPIGSPPVMRLIMIGRAVIRRTGDGAVDPIVAGGVEGLGEFGDRRRLAAGRPPMGDLEIGCLRLRVAARRTQRGPRPASTSSLVDLPGFSASLQVHATKGGAIRQSCKFPVLRVAQEWVGFGRTVKLIWFMINCLWRLVRDLEPTGSGAAWPAVTASKPLDFACAAWNLYRFSLLAGAIQLTCDS